MLWSLSLYYTVKAFNVVKKKKHRFLLLFPIWILNGKLLNREGNIYRRIAIILFVIGCSLIIAQYVYEK